LTPSWSSGSSGLIGPVLGCVLGLLVLGSLAFATFRRQRINAWLIKRQAAPAHRRKFARLSADSTASTLVVVHKSGDLESQVNEKRASVVPSEASSVPSRPTSRASTRPLSRIGSQPASPSKLRHEVMSEVPEGEAQREG
jgi:hypothetical protein